MKPLILFIKHHWALLWFILTLAIAIYLAFFTKVCDVMCPVKHQGVMELTPVKVGMLAGMAVITIVIKRRKKAHV